MPRMPTPSVDAFIRRMEEHLSRLERSGDERRFFHATYYRTTLAVKEAMVRGHFLDPGWVDRWDATFGEMYLDPLERWERREPVPGPWQIAFEAAERRELPPLRLVLLGMNAHINFDLPQSLLACVSDQEFEDPAVIRRRGEDHRRVDELLAARVPAEDRELEKVEEAGDRTLLDRLLVPFSRAGTKRFLKEARQKVWANARTLSLARREGPQALAARVWELEELSRGRVADLRAPGQVLLKMARRGFGVVLPGSAA